MRADGEGDRQPFAARHAGRVDALEVGRGGHVGPGLVSIAQTQTPAPDIPSSGGGIDGVVDGRTRIAAAVVGVLRMEPELCEIDVLSRDPPLLDGRSLATTPPHA